MTHLPPGAPDYFALFQSMFTPGAAQPAVPPNPFAMLDPKELEKKIGELQTVLAWLKATTGVIEMSIDTMKYQQSMLETLGGKASTQPEPATAPDLQELARMAEAMNPARWAMNMMPQPLVSAPEKPAKKTVKKESARAPDSSTKKRRR